MQVLTGNEQLAYMATISRLYIALIPSSSDWYFIKKGVGDK